MSELSAAGSFARCCRQAAAAPRFQAKLVLGVEAVLAPGGQPLGTLQRACEDGADSAMERTVPLMDSQQYARRKVCAAADLRAHMYLRDPDDSAPAPRPMRASHLPLACLVTPLKLLVVETGPLDCRLSTATNSSPRTCRGKHTHTHTQRVLMLWQQLGKACRHTDPPPPHKVGC